MKNNLEEYRKSETWIKKTDSFAIEIKRWSFYSEKTLKETEKEYLRTKNNWNIYVYVYNTHPLFEKLKKSKMYSNLISDIPLHGGCTLFKKNRNEKNKIITIQIGCDYMHYGDGRFENIAIPNYEIINDAQELFEYFEEMVKK